MCVKPILLLFAVFFLCNCSHHQAPRVPSGSSPNVLLILVDDMGYGDVTNMGNSHVHTTNLDWMADQSVRFKYFYVSPVCAPTRASILTGRYHQRTGVRSVTNGFETMDPSEVTIAELLKENGYRTGIFGKWHLGEHFPSIPNAQGFDEFLGFRTGHTSDYFDPILEHNGEDRQLQGYITDILSDKALAFMEDDGRPFFCYLAYNAPHSPLQIDSAYFLPFIAAGLDERTARIYGMIDNLDDNIGRVFKTLDQNKTTGRNHCHFSKRQRPYKWLENSAGTDAL